MCSYEYSTPHRHARKYERDDNQRQAPQVFVPLELSLFPWLTPDSRSRSPISLTASGSIRLNRRQRKIPLYLSGICTEGSVKRIALHQANLSLSAEERLRRKARRTGGAKSSLQRTLGGLRNLRKLVPHPPCNYAMPRRSHECRHTSFICKNSPRNYLSPMR